MDLRESNTSTATGKKRGTSGWIKPRYYPKHKALLGKICEKTTGYMLVDFDDSTEHAIISNDYRTLYKHFYYVDESGELKDRSTADPTQEKTDQEETD